MSLLNAGFVETGSTDDLIEFRSPDGCDTYLVRNPGRIRVDFELRSRLAEDQRKIFVKTHSLPFEPLLPGEHTVFLVRHPCAILTSYQRFLLHFRRADLTLDELVDDDLRTVSGSYLTYHSRYVSYLKTAYHLVVRYEDKANRNEEVIQSLASFCGIPVLRTTQPSLQQYPMYAAGQKQIAIGKVTSWIDDIGDKDLKRVFSRVREVSDWFGYQWPDETDKLEYETCGDVTLTRSPAIELQFAVDIPRTESGFSA